MALAQQLDELALANSRGLLNDDEYRLLRQNLFEQHSHNTVIPVEAPALPVASPRKKASRATPQVRIVDTPVETLTPHVSPTRRTGSFTSGITNFFRRATGSKTSGSPPADCASSYEFTRQTPSTPHADAPKRGVIPKLQRKASSMFLSRGDSKRHNPIASSSKVPVALSDNSLARHAPNAPLKSPTRPTIPTFSDTQVEPSSSSGDIFDDRNLYTSKDIRAAIIATETEAERLLNAFNGLESTTSLRVNQQNARRLPVNTPEHVNILLDGSDWRNHRSPYPPSPWHDRKAHRHVPAAIVIPKPDNASVHSGSSSVRTSLSRSKSVSSLRSKQHATSPLSARFPSASSPPPQSILRKTSLSSISSQAASTTTTTRRIWATATSSFSRSASHLPLTQLTQSEDKTTRVARGDQNRPGTADTGIAPEVTEIQRRRDEVMARYAARLEYLQAKLKSAELHEKLLRR